jgi:hypothetical protein
MTSQLLSKLSSIYDIPFNENEKENNKICESSKNISMENILLQKKNYLEQPIQIPCNQTHNNTSITDINFITDISTVKKIIEYRTLEIKKKIELFKRIICLYQYFCILIQYNKKQFNSNKDDIKPAQKLKEQAKELIKKFIKEDYDLLTKSKSDIIFLQEQLKIKLQK